jgi:translation initiation factor 4B
MTGKAKGYGYVEFGSQGELKEALAKNMTSLGGRTIRVSVAEARTFDTFQVGMKIQLTFQHLAEGIKHLLLQRQLVNGDEVDLFPHETLLRLDETTRLEDLEMAPNPLLSET